MGTTARCFVSYKNLTLPVDSFSTSRHNPAFKRDMPWGNKNWWKSANGDHAITWRKKKLAGWHLYENKITSINLLFCIIRGDMVWFSGLCRDRSWTFMILMYPVQFRIFCDSLIQQVKESSFFKKKHLNPELNNKYTNHDQAQKSYSVQLDVMSIQDFLK